MPEDVRLRLNALLGEVIREAGVDALLADEIVTLDEMEAALRVKGFHPAALDYLYVVVAAVGSPRVLSAEGRVVSHGADLSVTDPEGTRHRVHPQREPKSDRSIG